MKTKSASVPPNVGVALNKLRLAQKLTLEQLARRSGVSRSMLSQIERNQTNPTVATMWRIANALGVSMDEILVGEKREHEIELIPEHAILRLLSSDRKCQMKVLGPLHLAGRIEWYDMIFEPHGALVSEPHEPGTAEHLTLIDGTLAVESGNQRQLVAVGETVRYRADQHHAIRNPGDHPARAIVVVTTIPTPQKLRHRKP